MKKFIVVALLIGTVGVMSACGSNKVESSISEPISTGASSDIIKKAINNKGYPENKSGSPAPSSQDWRTFSFTLNGKEYSLWRFTMDELDPNYKIIGDVDLEEVKETELKQDYRTEIEYHSDKCSDGYNLIVSYMNEDNDTKPLPECSASELNFTPPYTAEWKHVMDSDAIVPDVVLTKGITIGSTVDELVAAYGQPDQIDDRDGEVYIYREDSICWMEIFTKNGHVYGFDLVCQNSDIVSKYEEGQS